MIPLRTTGRSTGEESLWQRVVSWDEAALLRVHRFERAGMTRAMRALTHLGDTASWVLIGLLLIACGGRGPRYAALLGCGAGLAVLVSQVLKRAWCRPRPTVKLPGGLAALIEIPDAFSFPSGHTAVAFAIAVALAGEGHGLGPLTLSLASGIGVSRVYLRAHYPLDVAAGGVLGALAGLAARLLVGLAFPGLV